MSTLAQSRGVSFFFHVFLSMRIFLVPRSPMKDFNLSLRQEVFLEFNIHFFCNASPVPFLEIISRVA